jgi:hypothetical protein
MAMTAVGVVDGTSAVTPAEVTGSSNVAAAANASLLPAPGQLDSIGMLYLLETRDRELGLERGASDVRFAEQEKQQRIHDEIQQVQRAAEAARHHSFWNDVGSVCLTIGKVAAVVGSVAIAVASCGAGTAIAALAIAGCLMSTAGMAQGEFHVLQKLGASDGVANGIGVGLSVGGLAASGGASLLESSVEVGTHAASVASTVVSTTGRVATVVSAAGHLAGGAATVESAHYEAEETDRRADAKEDQFRASLIERGIQDLVDHLNSDDKATNRRLGYERGTIQAQCAALRAAVMTRA